MNKTIGRNDPCPCGSGKKYKKCCAQKPLLKRKTFKQLNASELQSKVQRIAGMMPESIKAHPPEKKDSDEDIDSKS